MLPSIPLPGELRERREAMGLSQMELGHLLGFTDNGTEVVRRWEQAPAQDPDRFKPRPATWAAFCYLEAMLTLYRAAPAVIQPSVYSLIPPFLR